MKYSNSIEYNISTKLDKSGLAQLQTQIKQVELTMQQMANKELLNPTKVQNAREQLQGLSTALNKAFNPSLGMLDLAQFRKELSNSKVTAEGLQSAFRLTGAQGSAAFSSLAKQIGHFNSGMERTSSAVDKMFVTFQNTFRWGLISSFFSQFMNAIHSSVEYARELDDSLTQIMLVTDYSRDSMNEYAKAANEAAKAVGQTTVGMTNASLIFAQQGYDLDQSQQLATLSAKLANASQQDTAATSDQITAYMNAYGLQDDMEALSQAMDNWALIANISAADVEEIALASQRAASMANAVGVSGEALAAQIATIESVTREAPEQIGNGLKTLYARFSDLRLGKEDEDGIGLGKVTSTLQQIGVQVLDSLGNVRNMDDIMEDLMVIWQDLDDTTQEAVAQTLAGKHQVNRFTALMDNADMYQEYLGSTGENASGTLEQMNQEYMDSLQGRMATLQATLESLFNDVFTTDMIYPLIDVLTKLAEAIDTLFKSVGGGPTIILGLASAFTQLFSQNIARSINDFASNQQLAETRRSNLANVQGALEQTGLNDTEVGQYIQAGADRAGAMNADQYRIYEQQLDSYITASENAAAANEKLNDTYLAVAAAAGMLYDNAEDLIVLDETGLNISGLIDEVANKKPEELAKSFKDIDWKPAIEGAEELSKSMGRLSIAIDKTKKDSQDLDITLRAWDKADDNLTILYETGAITKQTYEKLQGILSSTAEKLEDTGTVEGKVKEEFEQATVVIARYTEALKNIGPEVLAKGPEAVAKALRDQLAAQQALEQNTRANTGIIKNLDSQAVVDGLLKITSAVGQLVYAWQALANLPSIIGDKNLTDVEKFTRVLTNLTTVLPMIIFAFKSMKKASIELSIGAEAATLATVKEAASQLALNVSMGSSLVMHKQLTAGKWLETLATDALTVATQGLSAALSFFTSGPGLLVLGVIAAITLAINAEIESIKQAKEEALEAFHKTQDALQQIQQIQKQADNFKTSYDNYDGSNGQKLIDEANDIALAMKEAGYEAEAEAIHLATVRAKALDTAEGFEILANTIEESTRQAEASANLEVIEASEEVLRTQNKSMEDMIKNQADLRRAQEQLNNLDPWSPNYEARKAELEALIATLKETIKTEQDAVDAANAAMDAQGTLAGINALGLNGDNNGMQTRARGWENIEGPADTVRTADAGTLREFFSLNVQGFDALSSAEQLDFMLQHVQDDAQKAAIEVQQLFEANSSLGEHHFGETTYFDSEQITRELEQSGLSAQQSLTLIASLDPNASMQEILAKVHQIQAEMDANGGDFELALRATLDPEELERVKEQVKDSIPSMAPIDSDLNADAFQETAKYFYEMAGELEEIPEELAYSSEELQEFTEAVLRYDDALQDADEHLADWIDTLNDSSASISDQTEAFEGMRDLIGDLLDLDTSDLSHSFMQSAEAAELLDTAIYGTGEEADLAYGRLNALANLDMAGFLDWENGAASLNDRFYELSDSALNVSDNAQYAMTTLEGIMNGTITGPDINIDNFLAGLEDMVNSGEMSMDEAIAAMDGAEIEADVTTETQDADDVQETVGWHPVKTGTIDVSASNIPVGFNSADIGAGYTIKTADAHGTVEGWTYEPDIDTETESKSVTVSSVGYKANKNGTGTGKVHFSNGRHKLNSGGAKRAASGGGNHSRPSSGGSGSGCFVAGTLVSLQNQFKNIEDIQIGDIVLSYNEEIHQNEYSIVLQTMIHDVTEEIYDLYIEDEILTVTGIHRFYIRRKHDIEWVPASDLHIGDYVLFADGNWHPIFKIKIKVRSLLVYNFEVSHNHNYYVGRNQILAHNKGGGGGGGSKAKTIQPKEQRTHKKDYYEKVDSQLDKIKEQLSGIEKQEDKLIGDKARANQTKQLALLKREVDLQKEKLDILKTQEMPDVDKKLKEQYNSLKTLITNQGLDVELPVPHLNEDNIYDNFEDVSKAVDDVYNALIKKYNAAAAAGNEETTKAIDELIKKMDEEGKGVLESIQKHNDLQKTQVEWTNAIQDTIDAMQDLRIEAYKTSMEAIDDLKDLNKEWAEFEGFLTGLPTDSPFRSLTEGLSELNSSFEITKKEAKGFYNEIIKEKQKALAATSDATEKQAIQLSIDYFKGLRDSLTDDMLENGLLGLAMEDLKELRKWYENPNLEGNPFGDNTAALKEAYEDALKRVIELTQDWQDLQEEIIDDIVDGYGEIADKQERQISDYERLADRMEKFADLYALSYGEKSYKALSEIGNKQAETLKHQLSQQVNIYNYWADQYQKALDSGNEKLINEMKDKMDEAEDNMLDLAQDAAETFIDAYEKSIEAAIQKFNEKVIGDVDFDYLDLTWEWQDRLADGYLDDVESAFEIDKLRANYTDLLNDAQGASLATQNKIRQQMNEQLSILEDQETVSEYDVELANAKLNLLQKEIALEDAQRNKNQMQLRRDSQGNYRYVYRADQDEVNKAQREVFEAQQNIYKISKNHIEEVKKDIADIIKNYEEGIRKIANDPYLTEAEKEAKIKELTDYVNSIMPVLKEEFESAQNGVKTALNESIDSAFTNSAAAAEEMLGKILDKEGKFKTDSGIIWWDSANELTQKVFPAISEAMGKLSETAKTEGEKLRENLTGNSGVLSMISEDLSDKEGYTTSIEDATKKTIALDTATAGLNTQLQQETIDLQNVIKEVSSYNTTLEKASQDLQALKEDYEKLKETMADKLPNKIPGEIPAAEKKEDSKPTTTTTTTTNTNKDTKPTTNTNRLNKDKVIGAYNEIMSGRAGNGDARWRYLSGKGYTSAEQDAAQKVVNAVFGGSSRDAALKKIVGYATGGYTGEWSNDGKLAVLHQKELVLNADDTRNILSAVDIVRQMTSTLGNVLTNYSLGGATSSLMNSGFGGVEQRVEIKAEFPNVHDSFEIETALINLSDKAYQYAHRNI